MHKIICIILPRKWHRFSHNRVSVQRMVPEYMYHTSVNFWSRKEMDPIIPVSFMEHHAPSSPSYDGTSWINMGNYNSESLFIDYVENNFICYRERLWVLFLHHAPHKVQIHKIQYYFVLCVIELMNHSCLIWTQMHPSWRIKDQLHVTSYFISLLMCSTCFGH